MSTTAVSSTEFDIIFRGDIVFGHQLADVKLKLQQLFKSDAAKIDALFNGRPVPLKRNLDEATANKYRDALMSAGVMVDVCPSDKSPANAPAKPLPVRAEPRPVTPLVKQEWTLAPIGADLLPIRERSVQPAPVVVDISNLSVRTAEGNLLDVSEVHEVVSAQVVVPDLGLAAVGSDMIRADEKLALPLVEVELEDWDIAEAGSDLLTDDERPIVLPAIVEIGDYVIAPAGSDLGQLKVAVKPLNPDISGLRLADVKE